MAMPKMLLFENKTEKKTLSHQIGIKLPSLFVYYIQLGAFNMFRIIIITVPTGGWLWLGAIAACVSSSIFCFLFWKNAALHKRAALVTIKINVKNEKRV